MLQGAGQTPGGSSPKQRYHCCFIGTRCSSLLPQSFALSLCNGKVRWLCTAWGCSDPDQNFMSLMKKTHGLNLATLKLKVTQINVCLCFFQNRMNWTDRLKNVVSNMCKLRLLVCNLIWHSTQLAWLICFMSAWRLLLEVMISFSRQSNLVGYLLVTLDELSGT